MIIPIRVIYGNGNWAGLHKLDTTNEDITSVTVSKVKKQLQTRIGIELGKEQVFVPYLETQDGFRLPENDPIIYYLISQSFKPKTSNPDEKWHLNQPVIRAVDIDSFIASNKSRLNIDEAYCKIDREDFDDGNNSKIVRIGETIEGKLFVQLLRGRSTRYLNILASHELQEILNSELKDSESTYRLFRYTHNDEPYEVINSKDPNHPVSKNWFVVVVFRRPTEQHRKDYKIDDNRKVIVVEIRIKAGSDSSPSIDELLIDCTDRNVQQIGEGLKNIKKATSGDEAIPEKSLAEYKEMLGEPIAEGKDIPEFQKMNCQKHTDEGTSLIEMQIPVNGDDQEKLNSWVEATQGTGQNEDGTLTNIFMIRGITFTNRGAQQISVTNLNVDYKDHDGEWKPMKNAEFGVHSYGDFAWSQQFPTFEAGSTVNLAVRATVFPKGRPGRENRTRNRAHYSLPQPMVLRVKITDSMNRERQIMVEQSNEDPRVATKESIMKTWNVKNPETFRMVYCDNQEELKRHIFGVYVEGRDILLRFGSNKIEFDKRVIQTLEREAKKNKMTYRAMSNMKERGSDFHQDVHFLFDEGYYWYGARVMMSTTTNRKDETILIRDLVHKVME